MNANFVNPDGILSYSPALRGISNAVQEYVKKWISRFEAGTLKH
jgi:hypothetical protein